MSYFDPQRMPVLPARRREAARQQLEQVVARSPRRSKPVLIAAVTTAAVLSIGAGAAVVTFRPVTDTSQARCYTTANVAGGHYTTVDAAGRPGSRVQARDAIGMCAALFRQGFLTVGGLGIDRHADGRTDHRVPGLVVCTMRDGVASVFPGNSATCARLGLPAAVRPPSGSAS